MNRSTTLWVAASLLLAVTAAGAQGVPERFTGNVVDAAGAVRSSSAFFTLEIETWGTQEQAAAYLQILKDQGQKGLVDAFWEAEEAGFIKVGNSLGYPIIFAREIPVPEGRLVRAFTDRPIQFFEARRNTRSMDYPLGIIEIRFPAGAKKGEGIMVVAASAKFNEAGELEIENLGTQPFRLLNMRAEPVKQKNKK